MVEVFTDFRVQSGIRVFQDNVLLRFFEFLSVEVFRAATGAGECINVGPLVSTRA